MSKIVLDDTAGGYNLSKINSNFQKIEDVLNNEVLYRDNPVGEPNAMSDDLDMNHKRIFNLPEPVSPSEAARLQDVQNAISASAANLISFTPTGDIAATNVQAAIVELDNELHAVDAARVAGDLLIRSDFSDASNVSKGAALIGRGSQVVDSIAALRLLLKTTPSRNAFVAGYYAAGDGGGGPYYYDAADTTSADNGGTIIVAADGGRWKLAGPADWINVKQFGAKGDAVANDTARIQAAMDWIQNGTVFFPPGAYNVTATLTVKYDNDTGKVCTNLVGCGEGSTLLWNGGNNTWVIWYEATSAFAGTFSQTTIEGLFLKNQVSATGLTGIRLGNFAGSLGYQAGVGNVTIRKNRLDGFDYGVATEYESDGIVINDNLFSDYVLFGVYSAGSSNLRVNHNYFQFGRSGSIAVHCEYTTITVSDNLIQSSSTNIVGAIRLLNAVGFTIVDNYIEFALTGSQYAILLSNSNTGYIGQNLIQGMRGADCIYIDATSHNVNIGPNNYGFFSAAQNSLIRNIAGAANINVIGRQYMTGGGGPASPFLGAGYNFSYDNGTVSFGVPAYVAAPNSGITMAASGVLNIGNNAGTAGWGFETFNRSGVMIGSIAQTGTTGVVYNTTSDYRLKTIEGPVTNARDFVMALKPKSGTWKADGTPFVGFVAHEFQEVSPSSVVGSKDAVDEEGKPVYQAMQASSPEVIANLVALLQEQQVAIESLLAKERE